MAFEIKFTADARTHLLGFKRHEQKTIVEAVKRQLSHEPQIITKNRKPLRNNPLSRWELRAKKFRVFYDVDVDQQLVEIKAIGHKEHNRLFINAKEFII